MPTKKKRVGFIPRDNVMKIIDQLSYENNLSNSKIIGILVEEALSKRGLINTESKIDNENTYNSFINSVESHFNINEAFNSQTYKKFVLFMKFQEMMKKYEK